MAFAYTEVIDDEIGGKVISIAATEVGTSSRAGPFQVPKKFRVLRLYAAKTAGTAATIFPQVQTPAGRALAAPAAAAASPVDIGPQAAPCYSASGAIYVDFNPDAGSDNSITVEILLVPNLE